MVKIVRLLLAVMALGGWTGASAQWRGSLDLAAIGYLRPPLLPDQSQAQLQPQLTGTLTGRFALGEDRDGVLSFYARANSQRETPVSLDLREAALVFYGEGRTLRIGVLQEHWGVLEGDNLVDIVNQRDVVEDYQGEAKLGQPGVGLTGLTGDWELQLLVLPYPRERRLPEGRERLRIDPLPLAEGRFEGQRARPAVAGRATRFGEGWELALSHYWGHSREPNLVFTLEDGRPILEPYYRIIHQSGLELQWVGDQTLWKSELIYRSGGGDDFWALGAGLEHQTENVLGSRASLTTYLEFYRDGRSERAPRTAFDHDLFLGFRLALNDIQGTELEVTSLTDWEEGSVLLEFTGQRRLSSQWSVGVDVLVPLDTEDDPALELYDRDSRLGLHLIRYF